MICAPGYTLQAGQCAMRAQPVPRDQLGLWLGCLVLVAVAVVAVIWWRSR